VVQGMAMKREDDTNQSIHGWRYSILQYANW